MKVVLGVDLGTQGVRILAVNQKGSVVAAAQEELPDALPGLPQGWHAQDPETWWLAVAACLMRLVSTLPPATSIEALCIDSTSGTLVPLDGRGKPLYPALMYNDNRSQPYVAGVRQAGGILENKLGYAFNASFALPKIVWLMKEQAEVFAGLRHLASPTDFIVGRLSGDYGISDTSNALKSGYDLVEGCWPGFIEQGLGIPLERLPRVVLPGRQIARVNEKGAQASSVPTGTPLISGATDGTAAQIASGAVTPGAWNSTLGTTLVIKGITRELVIDPLRRIYCHRHPEGWWMPGGASNTGAEWIKTEYAGVDPAEMDRLASAFIPSKIVRYPLVRKGERFPFSNPNAEGFWLGQPASREEAYAAGLEGLALLERLAFETLQEIGAAVGEQIYVTGGGARSAIWLKVRASTLRRRLLRPAVSETAMGAALLAATGVWYDGLSQAARAMVTVEAEFEPDERLAGVYEQKYAVFREEMRRRGYC
jgi:sugar (pentulose or hexulose) kinase